MSLLLTHMRKRIGSGGGWGRAGASWGCMALRGRVVFVRIFRVLR